MEQLPAKYFDTKESLLSYFEDIILTNFETYISHFVTKEHEQGVKQFIASNLLFLSKIYF